MPMSQATCRYQRDLALKMRYRAALAAAAAPSIPATLPLPGRPARAGAGVGRRCAGKPGQ